MKRAELAESIADRPRVMLPFPRAIVRPGELLDMFTSPQIPMSPPYWLGLRCGLYLNVQRLMLGNVIAGAGWGEVPGQFFAVDHESLSNHEAWPLGLVPIAGPPIGPGYFVTLSVRNVTTMDVPLEAVLWGTGEEIEPVSVSELGERARSRDPAWQARAADERATAEAEAAAGAERYELGDAWETPGWDE